MTPMDAAKGMLMGTLLALAGCDAGGTLPPCASGADCASGVCMPDGRCAPRSDAGAPDEDAGRADGGLLPRDAGSRDAGSDRCRPNGDGVVTRAEAPFGPGLSVRYRAATDVGVDTVGADLGSGRRRWDFSAALPGDHDVDLATEPLAGRWFADRFAGAQYAARLSSEADLLGVFRVTDTAVELLGVVSPEDGIGRTELAYAPPVRVLVFPLEPGLRWTSDSRVTGLAEGLAVNYGETYASEVDARGEVVTPYAPFESLRVQTTLTRDLTFSETVTQQLAWVAECFGTVATAVSAEGEVEREFDSAAELRRLSF